MTKVIQTLNRFPKLNKVLILTHHLSLTLAKFLL